MAEPTTQQEFIDYTFRALGEPISRVQVSPQQAEERLGEALHYFHERHPHFQQRALFLHSVTSQEATIKSFDVDTFGGAVGTSGTTGASAWPTGEDIVSISRVHIAGAMFSGDYIFDIRYQMALFDVFGLYYNNFGYASDPMANYVSTVSYLQMIRDTFNYPPNFTFAETTRRLTIETSSTDLSSGRYILVEANVAVDPDLYPALWQNRIFKRYYAALLKKQWAQNLGKFEGIPMIGGAKLNAAAMKSDAEAELANIEQQIESQYIELPIPRIG